MTTYSDAVEVERGGIIDPKSSNNKSNDVPVHTSNYYTTTSNFFYGVSTTSDTKVQIEQSDFPSSQNLTEEMVEQPKQGSLKTGARLSLLQKNTIESYFLTGPDSIFSMDKYLHHCRRHFGYHTPVHHLSEAQASVFIIYCEDNLEKHNRRENNHLAKQRKGKITDINFALTGSGYGSKAPINTKSKSKSFMSKLLDQPAINIKRPKHSPTPRKNKKLLEGEYKSIWEDEDSCRSPLQGRTEEYGYITVTPSNSEVKNIITRLQKSNNKKSDLELGLSNPVQESSNENEIGTVEDLLTEVGTDTIKTELHTET